MQNIETIAENSDKLRFGILCNSYCLKKWQIRTIENLSKSGVAEICLLVVNANKTVSKNIAKRVLSWFWRNVIYRVYSRLFFKIDSLKEIDFSENLRMVPVISCHTAVKGKYSEYFLNSDIIEINKYKLDFILRFGFNIIRGEILNAAKYGVWSFHHDDEQKYRGGPAGFWEIYNNDPVNGAILQRLTNSLDSGMVLKKGFFKTIDHSYSANYENLLDSCIKWPLQVCIDIRNGVADYFAQPPALSVARIYKVPGNFRMLVFIVKLIRNKCRFHYRELFYSEQWNIGIVKKPIDLLAETGISENKAVMMPVPKPSCFRADCFAYSDRGKIRIYFENYNYRIRKGNISYIEYTENTGFVNEMTLLSKPYHLSYPFIFSLNSDLYCVPETFENKQVDLYRIDAQSGCLKFCKTLLSNTSATDSTLFFDNGKWWFFCTLNSCKPNEELHLYYSENFDGPYIVHPANPVKTDIRSSRPAGGLFLKDGYIYRPAQDSSKTYGGRIAINKINKLSIYEYSEETVNFIEPLKQNKFRQGIHTICDVGDYTVFDAKRYIFVGLAFTYQFNRKFNKFLRRKRND